MEQEKDERYKYPRNIFNTGQAKTFADMFSGYPFLPKTVLGEDLGYHNDKITRVISHPEEYPISVLCDICDQIEIESGSFIKMIVDNYISARYKPKK